MECVENGSDMVEFTRSHQDPGSAILNALEPLQALAWGPDEKCVTVIQPGGDEGVDQLLGIRHRESGAEFGYIAEVEKGCLAEVIYVGFIMEVWVHFDTKVCKDGGKWEGFTGKTDVSDGGGFDLMGGADEDGFCFTSV